MIEGERSLFTIKSYEVANILDDESSLSASIKPTIITYPKESVIIYIIYNFIKE